VAVNCVTSSSICSANSIRGYPTIKAFIGERVEEVAKRDADELVAYLQTFETSKPGEEIIGDTKESAVAVVEKEIESEGQVARLRAVKKEEDVFQGIVNHNLYSRLQDIAAAARLSVEYALVSFGTPDFNNNLSQWLKLLSTNLPSSTLRLKYQQLGETINTEVAAGRLNEISEWSALVRQYGIGSGADSDVLVLCDSYPCSLWMLFHSLTVASSLSRVTSTGPLATATGIRAYVENFFGCVECRSHFLSENPLSVLEAIGDKEDKVILWLWKMHNGVSTRLNKRVTFPQFYMCQQCFNSDNR
jgi:hypothetical protein